MHPSLSLSGLSWSTPDGSPLFADLDLTFPAERSGIVGRNGVGKSTLLRLIAGQLAPRAGQIRLTGRAAMMRQDLAAGPDERLADLFGARAALELLARAEAGSASADELAEADWSLPARLEAALLHSGLDLAPLTPLRQLSGGQRSRAALAGLIFEAPDYLLLDEPTNNLDAAGRQGVIELLRGWKGGALVVSHDRALLEEMDAIIELTSLGATRYGGPYSAYRARKDDELSALAQDLSHAEKTRDEAARRAREEAERKARKDGAGKRARARGGAPKLMLDAAKGRAEATSGGSARLREARRGAADEALQALRAKVEILPPLRMDLPPTGLAAGKTVLRLEGLTGGYQPGQPILRGLSLSLTGPERLVIAGPNGSGKSTLLKLITGQLAPESGKVELGVPFALLDQHLGLLAPGESLLANLLRLNPQMQAHQGHAALARFGFRARDALRLAGSLSGGERLRAGLAAVLGASPPPALLILDEPTNHLDLEGIQALEAALAGYDGAILAVSHDAAFLEALKPSRRIALPG